MSSNMIYIGYSTVLTVLFLQSAAALKRKKPMVNYHVNKKLYNGFVYYLISFILFLVK